MNNYDVFGNYTSTNNVNKNNKRNNCIQNNNVEHMEDAVHMEYTQQMHDDAHMNYTQQMEDATQMEDSLWMMGTSPPVKLSQDNFIEQMDVGVDAGVEIGGMVPKGMKKGELSQDNKYPSRCGTGDGFYNMSCETDRCCSSFGWCGTGTQYCNSEKSQFDGFKEKEAFSKAKDLEKSIDENYKKIKAENIYIDDNIADLNKRIDNNKKYLNNLYNDSKLFSKTLENIGSNKVSESQRQVAKLKNLLDIANQK